MRTGRTSNFSFSLPNVGVDMPVVDGLVAHFNADFGVQTNGSQVVDWANQVGGTTAQTFGAVNYIPSDSNFNGKASISVDGGAFLAYKLRESYFNALTITAVFRRSSYTNGMVWALQPLDGNTGVTYDLWNNQPQIGINNFNSNCFGPVVNNAIDNATVVTVSFVYGQVAALRFHLNGVDVTANSVGGVESRELANYLRMATSSAGYAWHGQVCRYIVWDRVLNGQELDFIHEYLKNYYAIS